ncbi:MAG: hypothetical protein EB141_02980 [Verrucomicrobia bacterium]|nr:hypothetical protein [Verrucomicrobiota bacterium]NBU08512.1 hypothetical protein [Pseudomonadota bacterium]NDA66459.1 hypothetical protein [Verrucomicrobiota bacterium]NDB74602.1 hypothetical protein [Verrucomicrobiota bacterium]NDD38863.1 hypothetical protein [Verrucomicrobiota bacterium]
MSSRLLQLSALALLTVGVWFANRPVPVTDAPKRPITAPAAHVPAVARAPARPRLPVPQPAVAPVRNETGVEDPTNSLARLLNGGEIPKLTREQLDTFLLQNKRSAECLLTASRALGDVSLLREAAGKFPQDPRVQFDLALRGESPEEKRRALAAFRQLARDNPLGDYLSALDRFKAGQPDEAVRDLWQASGKHRFQDYTIDHVQSAEEAYLSAGYSPLEAKAAGLFGVLLPHLSALRELGNQMSGLQQQYAQAGDLASAQAVGQIGLNLASQLEGQPARTLISELVGMAIEKKFLAGQSADSPLGDGRTVGGRLAELEAQRQTIRDVTQLTALLPTLPPQEALTYFDRLKLSGELDALRWLQNKHARP